MAAPTVTYDQPTALPMSGPWGFISGKITISSYDTAHPSANIEGKFRGLSTMRVVIEGISSNGYRVRWNPSDGSVRCFQSAGTNSAPTITTGTNAGTTAPVYTNGGALTQTTGATGITGVQASTFTGTADAEVGSSVNVGDVNFAAFGLCR